MPVISLSTANLLLGKHSPEIRILSFASVLIIILISILLIYANVSLSHRLIYGGLMMLFTLLFWWISNSPSELFQATEPDASVGGDTSQELGGSTEGFEL